MNLSCWFNAKTVQQVEELLDEGIFINTQDPQGRTILFYVNNVEVLIYLIQQGLDINFKDDNGCNALFFINNFSVIEYLVNYTNIDVNCLNNNRENALFYQKNVNILHLLIRKGANVNLRSVFRETFLDNKQDFLFMIEIFEKTSFKIQKSDLSLFNIINPSIFQAFVDYGANIFIRNDFGQNLMFSDKMIGTYVYLLSRGLDVNSIDNQGNNVLFFHKNKQISQFFIDHGINIHQINHFGENCLFYQEDPSILEYLLDQGLNVNLLNKQQENALCCVKDDVEKAMILSDGGINLHQLNAKGQSLLFNKIVCGQIIQKSANIIRYYLTKNLSLQADCEGNNALFNQTDLSVVKLLVEAGVNINQRNFKNENCLYHQKNPQILKYLIDQGAEVDDTLKIRTLLLY